MSQQYYETPFFGWIILLSNPEFGGLENNIYDGAMLKIPYPLETSLLDYKNALFKEIEKDNKIDKTSKEVFIVRVDINFPSARDTPSCFAFASSNLGSVIHKSYIVFFLLALNRVSLANCE